MKNMLMAKILGKDDIVNTIIEGLNLSDSEKKKIQEGLSKFAQDYKQKMEKHIESSFSSLKPEEKEKNSINLMKETYGTKNIN